MELQIFIDKWILNVMVCCFSFSFLAVNEDPLSFELW